MQTAPAVGNWRQHQATEWVHLGVLIATAIHFNACARGRAQVRVAQRLAVQQLFRALMYQDVYGRKMADRRNDCGCVKQLVVAEGLGLHTGVDHRVRPRRLSDK